MTSSVAAWLAGSRANHGWIVLPTGGTNGVQVELSTSGVGTTAVFSPFLDFTTLFASAKSGILSETTISQDAAPALIERAAHKHVPGEHRRRLLFGNPHTHIPHTHTPHTHYPPPSPLAPPAPPRPPPAPPSLPPPPTFSYTYNGENSSYTGGCQSTWIRSDPPDYNGGQDTVVSWDGSSSVGHFDSALVQFTNIIGLGPNQLRPHEYIQRATLRYNVDETFSAIARGATAQLHEISKEWSANSTTFRTFVGAQGLNEDEYRTPAIATALANRSGWFEIDVTASVRSWVRGVGNNGWIWRPSPQNLGGSGDGSQMRACSAPPDRRVNLVVFAALQPPRPPSPPAPPPPPPARPPPPPSPPHAPFTVLQIRNAQHARLRMVAPDANYVNDVGVLWDGNSACAPAAHQTRSPRGRLGFISCCSQRPHPDVPLLCSRVLASPPLVTLPPAGPMSTSC